MGKKDNIKKDNIKNVKTKKLLLLKILIIALVVSCGLYFAVNSYAAEKWPTMTITDDLSKDMAELEHYCLMHDVTVADVLWANNITEQDLAPGTQILLPNSQPDVLSIWQHRGAWKPKALVQTTSAAAAERARGVSGVPAQTKQQTSLKTPAEAEISAQIQRPLNVKTQNQKENQNEKEEEDKTLTQAQAHKIPANIKADNKSDLETDPIIILSPNGDPATGPMRLIISDGQVKVVNISKNAAPKVPTMPDLDHPFGAHLIPNPSQPLPPSDPSRILPRFRQNRTSNMIWPVDGKVSSPFGQRGQRRHDGIDIPMPPGTPIRVARDGIVAITGNNNTMGFRGYGNFVLVDHGGGIKTLYAHCSKVTVTAGQRLRQGDYVALVGRTGRASTDHVHFEVRVNDKAVNPMPYLERVQVAKK